MSGARTERLLDQVHPGPPRQVGVPVWAALSVHPPPHRGLPWSGARHDQEAGLLRGGMVAVTTYRVTARRWALGWELHIDGVGVTQSRTLLSAEDMVREYIALQLDLDDTDSFDVEIVPELDGNLASEAEAVRETKKG